MLVGPRKLRKFAKPLTFQRDLMNEFRLLFKVDLGLSRLQRSGNLLWHEDMRILGHETLRLARHQEHSHHKRQTRAHREPIQSVLLDRVRLATHEEFQTLDHSSNHHIRFQCHRTRHLLFGKWRQLSR